MIHKNLPLLTVEQLKIKEIEKSINEEIIFNSLGSSEKVNDDEKAAKVLWENFSLRVMPGSYMAKDVNGFNPGKGFLRISLVDKKEIIEETMERICLFLKMDVAQE